MEVLFYEGRTGMEKPRAIRRGDSIHAVEHILEHHRIRDANTNRQRDVYLCRLMNGAIAQIIVFQEGPIEIIFK